MASNEQGEGSPPSLSMTVSELLEYREEQISRLRQERRELLTLYHEARGNLDFMRGQMRGVLLYTRSLAIALGLDDEIITVYLNEMYKLTEVECE